MQPFDAHGRRTDAVDQSAPHGRLPSRIAAACVFRSALGTRGDAVKNLLPRHSLDATAGGVDHQPGMDEKTSTEAVADRAQVGRRAMRSEIELRRIIDDQLRFARSTCLARVAAVRLDDCLKRHPVGVEQAVRRFQVAPRFGLIGRAAIRPCRHLHRQLHDSPISPPITQFTFAKLTLRPRLRIPKDFCHPRLRSHGQAASAARPAHDRFRSSFPELRKDHPWPTSCASLPTKLRANQDHQETPAIPRPENQNLQPTH